MSIDQFSLGDSIPEQDRDADAYGASLLGGPGLSMNPLSIASIEDIVEELKSRYDGMVIGVMVRSEKSNKSRVRQWYRGDYFTTLGMLHFMIAGQEADEDDDPDAWDGGE